MQPDSGPGFWLTQWNWQPTIIIGTIMIMVLYLYAVGPLREKYHLAPDIKTSKVVVFLLGVYIIFFALFSPIDKLGDTYLFSAHMVQHLMLTIIGPPLMVIGMPAWLIEPLLRKAVLLRIGKFLVNPLITFFLFNVAFWIWHAPPLYNAALYDERLHILEHMIFIGTSLLYWWPIFSPMKKDLPRLQIGGQMLYIFLGGMPAVLLGAGLTFTEPLYAPYIHAPRIWGISPVFDQQLGGLIMWVPGNILFIVYASLLFIRWMQEQDARQRAHEARLYAEEDKGQAAAEQEDEKSSAGEMGISPG